MKRWHSGVDVLLTSPHLPTLLQLRDAVSTSWQYSASQLQDCKSRLQESYKGIQELNADLDQKEALIEERQQDLETPKQELVRMSRRSPSTRQTGRSCSGDYRSGDRTGPS